MEVVKDPSHRDRWIVVYTAYLDSRKTIAQGRRIPKEQACENVAPQEMVAACNRLGLNGVAERKMYSRDWGCVGIVKIQLYDSNGAPLRSDIPNRKSLYLLLAKNIKESPRTPREEVELPKPITVQTAPTSEKAIKKKQKKQKTKMIRA